MYALVGEIDPALTTPCELFDFQNPPVDPKEFAVELVKFMRDNNGIGLAANQVGQSWRVFSIRTDPNRVLFNPEIVWLSEEEIALEEGCLSFPGLFVKIKRPKHVRVRYTRPDKQVTTELFTGMSARVVQHEMDHLNGILFYNRANLYHREKAWKDRVKVLRKAAEKERERWANMSTSTHAPIYLPERGEHEFLLNPHEVTEVVDGETGD